MAVQSTTQSESHSEFWWRVAGLFAGLCAALAFVLLVPQSLGGNDPKTAWYLARVTGLGAYGLFWASVVLGLLITSRTSRLWPGGPAAFDVHQFSSLAAIGLAGLHGVILLGDQFMKYSVADILVPFASSQYKPVWIGIGQIAMYLGLIVSVSFYIRKRIGHTAWRAIHYLAFAVYSMVLIHGIVAGTDTGNLAVTGWYFASGGIVLFLLFYRLMSSTKSGSPPAS